MIDSAHNWSVNGRTRHESIRQNFLREVQEENVLSGKWISTEKNSADLFTKNLPGPKFDEHTAVYCGMEYMNATTKQSNDDSQGEGVGGHA